MKILFYVSPFVVRGDPSFFAGAIRKKLLPQARLLLGRGHEVGFALGEFDADLVRGALPQCRVDVVGQRELANALASTGNPERRLYRDGDPQLAARLRELLAARLPADVDVVIAWETPSNLFRDLYPQARIVHQMPGFLSRVPFPELFTLDAEGLFHESMLTRRLDEIRRLAPDPRALALLDGVRTETLGFIAANTPFTRAGLDPHGQFSRLVLLPLQVTEQYAFQADSGYESQMALLLDVLGSVPAHIGIVVSQYVSASSAERVLDIERHQQLKAAYPNLIFDPAFDRLDNVSQYLLPAVDAVITVSSSLGMQALLCGKPLITLGDSHLRGLATHASLAAYADAVAGGGEPAVDADRVLAWILAHHQPLAAKVLHDGEFLERWLLALPAGRDPGVLPSFFDLDPGYAIDFSLGSKRERAGELLAAAFRERGNDLLAAALRKKIQETKPRLISFDIFDTLVDRSVEQPAHVFRMIEAEVERISEGRISNFQSVRQGVERSLRESIAIAGERQEISLAEIYDEIMARYGLSETVRDAICSLEVEEEMRVLRRREAGWRLYEAAKASGCRVILISDMYLPEAVVRRILEGAGYPESLPLYLSSTLGLRKHEGDLFTYVQSAENVACEQWLHIGDNPHGDVAVPRKLGIATHRITSAYHLIGANKKLGRILQEDRKSRSMAESALYGLIQRRYFDDAFRAYPGTTHFGGDPFILGYVGLGPLLYGFLHWVMSQARRDGIDRLLFLSRDGKVLWRMAQVLFPESEGWPAIGYAMSSRRAARVASLYSVGDISKLLDSSLSATTLEQFFAKKLGIELCEADDALVVASGFESREARVAAAQRESLRQLAMSLAERILDNAAKERKLLAEHYRQLGVLPGARVGVVDIGYAGTMQAAMERITGVTGIAGYYYITFDSALEVAHRTGTMRGYAGDFVKPKIHHESICRNGFLYETLFCSADASFLRFRDGPRGMEACFDPAPEDGVRRHLVHKAHDGAVVLARDLRAAFGHRLADLAINSVTASRLLADFIASPSGRDAEIFEGCLFDDSFAGSQARYIVPPRQLIARQPQAVAAAIWKEGAAVFGRRTDIFDNAAAASKPVIVSTAREPAVREGKGDTAKPAGLSGYVGRIERRVIRRMVRSERKLAKYERDRKAFFADSRDVAAQLYWRLLGRHLRPLAVTA